MYYKENAIEIKDVGDTDIDLSIEVNRWDPNQTNGSEEALIM